VSELREQVAALPTYREKDLVGDEWVKLHTISRDAVLAIIEAHEAECAANKALADAYSDVRREWLEYWPPEGTWRDFLEAVDARAAEYAKQKETI
jgi:hypothetical protein